jgi:lipopolysaccharide export system protein LptA
MVCKFRAVILNRYLSTRLWPVSCLLCLALLASLPAGAERADRSKPMAIEADQPGSVDLQRQVVIFNGNVVITQGTMLLRADRVELRERPDGYREAKAIGSATRPANFRQKRDGVDETVEGAAERIEFDAKTDTLRLVGNAAVRRLRAGVVADEITGSLITWDNTNELFNVTGGAASPANPTGRVRAVFAPREEEAASAPKATEALPLKRSGTLGTPR